MDREEAIKIVRNIYQTDAEKEALGTLIPELAESEGERIRKELIQFLRDYPTNLPNGKYSRSDFFAWLERQKEQKSVEWTEEDNRIREGLLYMYMNERLVQTPIGIHARDIVRWLKSLRPHPIQLKEAYKDGFQTARHATALTFMNYLDENRPEGKMSLSNGECEDIDKAFKENDWAKIIRYANKYLSQWKPSEEDIKMLEHIIGQYETGNKNSKVMGYLPRVEELNFLKKILDIWKN